MLRVAAESANVIKRKIRERNNNRRMSKTMRLSRQKLLANERLRRLCLQLEVRPLMTMTILSLAIKRKRVAKRIKEEEEVRQLKMKVTIADRKEAKRDVIRVNNRLHKTKKKKLKRLRKEQHLSM